MKSFDIVISKDEVQTLVNIAIIDPIHIDLLAHASSMHGFTISKVTQTKERSYQDHLSKTHFIFSPIW